MASDVGRNGDDDLLVKVAWLYYVADRNQEQIAAQLGMSRFKITRLLTRAREQGIIKFVIDPQSTETLAIAEQFAFAYGLTECIVTPPLAIEAPDADEVGRRAVGMAAASFLVRRLQGFDHVTIGLGWGRTMAAMVQAFPSMAKPTRDSSRSWARSAEQPAPTRLMWCMRSRRHVAARPISCLPPSLPTPSPILTS